VRFDAKSGEGSKLAAVGGIIGLRRSLSDFFCFFTDGDIDPFSESLFHSRSRIARAAARMPRAAQQQLSRTRDMEAVRQANASGLGLDID
jgi:hypothetical protein